MSAAGREPLQISSILKTPWLITLQLIIYRSIFHTHGLAIKVYILARFMIFPMVVLLPWLVIFSVFQADDDKSFNPSFLIREHFSFF